VKYSHIVEAFFASRWAILPEKFEAIKGVLKLRASGGRVSDEEIAAIVAGSKRPSPRTSGNVAVIPIHGVICYRGDMFSDASGLTSVMSLTKQFRQAIADDSVKAIVFDVDSPGGTVDGVPELADEIFNARGPKKIAAVANTQSASAAYWLATSADELIVTPSGDVGSVGVFTCHEDWSQFNTNLGVKPTYIFAGKYKVEANPDEPLSDEARMHIQADIDSFYGMFVNAVARNRGVKPADVRNGFGQGRTVTAKDAVAQGMADRVATLDQTLSRFGATGQITRMESSVQTPGIIAGPVRAAENDDDAENEGGCDCKCPACEDDDCKNCSNPNCEDENCEGCPQQGDGDATVVAPTPAAVVDHKVRNAQRRRRLEIERMRYRNS
jgi:signal peptide peptidase SppA